MGTIWTFLSKIRTLFWFSKKGRETSPLPSTCVLVSVAEFVSISMNMPKYPWKCLNKLFWIYHGSEYAMIILHVIQAFEDASGSKKARVLNIARRYMQGLRRIPNMSSHGPICLNNTWICFSMPYVPICHILGHGLILTEIWLKMSE